MRHCVVSLLISSNLICTAQVLKDEKIPWEGHYDSYVEVKGGKFGMVVDGKVTIPTKYDLEFLEGMINRDVDKCYFRDGAHFAVGAEDKWGVLDNRGRIVVPFSYDYIKIERSYETNQITFAGVEKNGKCALMNAAGKLITGFEFDSFYGNFQREGYFNGEPKLLLSKNGKLALYDPATGALMDESVTAALKDEHVRLYNKFKGGVSTFSGTVLVPSMYDHVYRPYDQRYAERLNLYTVELNGKCGLYEAGKGILVDIHYNDIKMDTGYGKVFIIVYQNGKAGLLDSKGNEFVPMEYDYFSFDDTYIIATRYNDDRNFLISEDGKVTLQKN